MRLAVWLDRMKLPSGSMTLIPGFASRLFLYGAVVVRKWPVQPVSAMAVVVVVFVRGGEEASVGVTRCAKLCFSAFTMVDSSCLLGCLAVPLPYFFGPQTLSLPPFLFLMVASSTWPSALLRQVALVCAAFLLEPCVQQ
jgi:hypothetical protein